MIGDFLEYRKSDNIHSELIKSVIITENIQDNPDESIKINWQELKSINKDIIAWIRIKNTHIDYPILRSQEPLEYLNRSFNGEYNKNGSIFTINVNPFIDKITTIYGHNMKSGLMFTDISKYMNKDFFREHSVFEIYTESMNYKATVFSVYSIGERTEENNIKSLSFEDEIQYYKSKSVYPVENINGIEKIVKLSTCSYINNKAIPTDQRYFLIAKLEILE